MLSVANLHVAYGQSRVIHDLSFNAEKQQTIAILGRNGMGKTTLMKSLIGVLRRESGTIAVDGAEVSAMESYQRVARGIAFVPQGRQIFSTMSVEDNIRTGLETVRGPKRIPPAIYDLFPVLKDMRKRRGGNLSGGQQQQLAIARALVAQPKVLLLDEPTEGIQPSVIKDIARTLNEIKRTLGLTIVVSEQVLSFALEIADRVLVIEAGRIIRDDPRSAVDEAAVARHLSV
jgi:urea transport system ATP-binding protein